MRFFCPEHDSKFEEFIINRKEEGMFPTYAFNKAVLGRIKNRRNECNYVKKINLYTQKANTFKNYSVLAGIGLS